MASRFSFVPQDIDPNDSIRFEETTVGIEMSYAVAVARRGSGPGDLLMPNGVAIDINTNKIYVAEGHNSRISIFSETGDFLNSFTHEHMEFPFGIAIHQDNLYITDSVGKFFFHFNVSTDTQLVTLVKAYIWHTYGIGQFIDPRGLAISPKGDVFVADPFIHRIQVLNSHLRYQWHISHHSMKSPIDIKLTPEDIYVLTCIDAFCIHVFSHSGDKIRSLITCGKIGKQIKCPLFFCLDANLNLIISDSDIHQVKVFLKE